MGLLTLAWTTQGYWEAAFVFLGQPTPLEDRAYLPKITRGTLVLVEVRPNLLEAPLPATFNLDRTCSQGFGKNKRKQSDAMLSVKDFEISSNPLF